MTIPLLINGEEILPSNSDPESTFPVVSPSTHTIVHTCTSASPAHASAALAAAQVAFSAWSRTTPAHRRNIIMKAADLLEARAQELIKAMCDETGSQEGFAVFNVHTVAEQMRDTAGRISGAVVGWVPQCADEDTTAMVLKEPYGVVLGIAPWNAPYILGVRAVLCALAAGNTCILKGSELSPLCYHHIGRAFTEAGLPPGALNVIFTSRSASPAITTQLISAPEVKKINFTGSTAIGALIAAACGKALKPCLLELGGKASAIVLEDADLDKAATACMLGAFLHAGQVCMSTERILVHEAVVDEFREKFKNAVAGFSPEAMVLVQGAGVEKNRVLVADALGKGAQLLTGHEYMKEEVHPETGKPSETRLKPIVVEGVTKEMRLYREESFGPSVSLTAVKSDDEAIEIANDSEYGLNSAVFTKDLSRGLRVAKRLECGNIHINSMTIHDEASLPHGGVKSSGWGRFNGSWAFDEFLRAKTITFKA
ncbi:putative salicylaldehyde dehydrogenase protein [Favolaschia claudopus]|uniref:Salicylaldehyde dehydrogenase protein n=1 Tax=Favolaschia claudopus TaxID=2862362 RepID=A0AAW0CLC1_9AGAR